MIPGKQRVIGAAYPGAEDYAQLVSSQFNLSTARDPDSFVVHAEQWGSKGAYEAWLAAYRKNAGSFLDHPVWGADRDLGGGHYLYGAMDDRYASNAARIFGARGGLIANQHVRDSRACVVGAWDGTECLLLRAMGAARVDMVEEVPAFCEMAVVQYAAWAVPGKIYARSLYEMDIESLWQAYDLLYVPGVLYHLTDLPTAMVMLWAMLKPGGVLAFESITEQAGKGRTAKFLGASLPGWNWWSPTPECYEALMHDCGFPDGRTAERHGGRGWWIGSKGAKLPALSGGAAGFSRPDVLRTIKRLQELKNL
jgi:hypothetical protein